AGAQEVGQLEELRVGDPIAAVGAHEQAHLVAPEPSRLGRLVRLQLGRKGEVQQALCGNHRRPSPTAAGSSACASNRPNGAVSSSTRRRNAGAGTWGPGRCDRSTPGSASRCIWVFISPGSTTYTRI